MAVRATSEICVGKKRVGGIEAFEVVSNFVFCWFKHT